MDVAFFSTHNFEKDFFNANSEIHNHKITFFKMSLNQQSAPLAKGFPCVCCFVEDKLDDLTLRSLKEVGVRFIALRSAGYNNVDLEAADKLGILIARVPAYSPHSVAEYTVGLLLSLNRKIHKAYARVRDLNFSLEGLMGFDLVGKTVGVIGTGRIGSIFATIMNGFGCRVIAYDPNPNLNLSDKKIVTFVSIDELYKTSDIISLHLPLTPETKYMINESAFAQMKRGLVLLNAGRGALINSVDMIEALKSGQLAGAGLDVYEEEEGVFFKDLSDQVLKDDTLARLLTFPNVLMSSHQAFLTKEALTEIAAITLKNISDFESGAKMANQVHVNTHIVTNKLK
jgi:D-lactate dehydrogenase